MADWVHCNLCFRQPGDGKKFVLTSCGHIYCDNCTDVGARDRCQMCKATCTTIPLSSKMKSDVEVFFTDPAQIIKKHEKQIVQVIDFQKNHRQRLTAYNRDKLSRQNQLMESAQEAVQRTQDLERQIILLRQENAYLRKLANRGSSPKTSPKTNSSRSPPNSKQSTQIGGRKTPVHQTTYSSSVPHYPKSPDSSISPSSRSQSAIRPGRITVRTPPSDGRMGVIVGSPAAESRMSPGHTASGTPMACSPSQSEFLKLHAGETPNNPLRPTTPGTPAALRFFSQSKLNQHQATPSNLGRKPIQLAYNPYNLSTRVQSLGQTGKHKVCIFNIKKLKQDNNVLLEQTIKLKKDLQRKLVKERTDWTKLDVAKKEIQVLKKMLNSKTTNEEKLKQVHEQIDLLLTEKKQVQKERDQLVESLSVKEEDIKLLQIKLDELTKTFAQTKDAQTKLSDTNKLVSAENMQLKIEVEVLQKSKVEAENTILELQKEVSSLTQRVHNFEKTDSYHEDRSSGAKSERSENDGSTRGKKTTPIRKTMPFVPKTPKAPNVKLTPRLGCKTPGQLLQLMPRGSGKKKRSVTAVLTTDNASTPTVSQGNECMDDDNDHGDVFRMSPKKTKYEVQYNDKWSPLIGINNEDCESEFQFKPQPHRRYKVKGKRRKKTLCIDN